jgi:putative transposase
MKSVPKKTSGRKNKLMGEPETLTRLEFEAKSRLERIQLIQQLIPIGLMAVAEELQREVKEITERSIDPLTGKASILRYGFNSGSVALGGQRVPVKVPRLRKQSGEVPLSSYELLHRDSDQKTLYNSILSGVSCRDYESTIKEHKGAISKSKSTISRQFVAMSSKQLKEFQERRLEQYDCIAFFMDGKSFAKDQMVVALGVTVAGKKIILGFVQTATENAQSIGLFLESLLARGLNIDQGILAVTDGAKGLIKALKDVFRKKVIIQRCQWHKRENIVSHLAKSYQVQVRRLLQAAYERPTLQEAQEALQAIMNSLNNMNQSAANSLKEGLEETLSLHRLDLFGLIGQSFKTTNCLESVNSAIEKRCGKTRSWTNSLQKERWLATALLDIEPTLHRVRSHEQLPTLRLALKKALSL